MEEHRCKIVASGMDDSRMQGPLFSGPTQSEDPRYTRPPTRAAIQMDDCRLNTVAIAMEDPRCQSLRVTR
jgi:hypothetical protein